MILLFSVSAYIAENISMETAFVVVGLIKLIIIGICGVYFKRTNNKELISESEELEVKK